MIKKLFENKIVSNAGWLIGGKIIQMAISLIVSLLTARYLGPSNYGVINYAAAYTAFFAAFCTLGLNSIMVKELIDNPEEEGEIMGTALFLRAISSVLSAIVILCIVSVVDRGDRTAVVVVFLNCIGMLFNIFELFSYWFQSRLQSKITAQVTLIAYVITTVYKIFIIVSGKSVEWFALITALDYACLGLLLYVMYVHEGGQKLKVSLPEAKKLLRKSYHFILPSLMVAVYAQTDKIMLKQMINSTEIGYYSTASTLCRVWCFVLVAIIDSMYPEIAKAHKTDRNKYLKINKQLYAIVFYMSCAVSLVFTFFGEFAIKIMYGDAYLPAIEPLKIITWYTAFSYLGVARNAWIVCEGKQKFLKYVYMSAAVSNVILNMIFIPYWGASGAAIASLVAQIITTMIAPLFINELKENTAMMMDAIRLRF